MSARIRRISTLKICQKAGTVTVSRDPISKCAKIKATFQFVLYVNWREEAITLFGLGDCGTFDAFGRRFQQYIENSTIRIVGGTIFENKIRRTVFTRPSTEAILPHRTILQLTRISLKGNSRLGDISQFHISNPLTDTLRVSLKNGAQLVASLPIASLHCTLAERCAIKTCVALNDTTHLLWILDYLHLDFTGKGCATGIYVKKGLIIRDTHNSTIEISNEADCRILNERSTVFGIPASPQRQPVVNEHGMVVWEERIDQDVLDASRASYESESRATGTTPLFEIQGDRTGKDTAAGDGLTCLACMTNSAVVAMGGCGHVTTCIECTNKMCNYTSVCLMCRKEIGTAVILFISH